MEELTSSRKSDCPEYASQPPTHSDTPSQQATDVPKPVYQNHALQKSSDEHAAPVLYCQASNSQ